jgi:outer membrane protein OmpA-like peptidoglycan-associated protein
MTIELSGHTDNKGKDKYNMNLSLNRAKAVYTYLIEHGIKENRLRYKGFGATQPIADNKTDEGRAKNRRVEFKILSL